MIPQGEGCREDVGGRGEGGWQHTRQTLEKSPTSKLYTTWAHILSDRNVFAPRGGGGKRRGPMPLGLFLFISYLLIPKQSFLYHLQAHPDISPSPIYKPTQNPLQTCISPGLNTSRILWYIHLNVGC